MYDKSMEITELVEQAERNGQTSLEVPTAQMRTLLDEMARTKRALSNNEDMLRKAYEEGLWDVDE